MTRAAPKRTVYGPNKYAAFHLLLARWLRHHARPGEYRYVTLGGTELRDIQSVHFIDPLLASSAVSFESEKDRELIALATSEDLQRRGVVVKVIGENVFTFRRTSDGPHFFFVDLEGVCASADYHLRFADLLRQEIIRENDTLFITSYLGRNPGWERLFRAFDAEFRILGLVEPESKRIWYRRAHPSFTLFRALAQAGLQQEIAIECVGCVEYRDTSCMALYGYVIGAGVTAFGPFVRRTPYFHVKKGYITVVDPQTLLVKASG